MKRESQIEHGLIAAALSLPIMTLHPHWTQSLVDASFVEAFLHLPLTERDRIDYAELQAPYEIAHGWLC